MFWRIECSGIALWNCTLEHSGIALWNCTLEHSNHSRPLHIPKHCHDPNPSTLILIIAGRGMATLQGHAESGSGIVPSGSGAVQVAVA